MTALPGILAKLALFLVTAAIGATAATVAVSALKDHSPVSTAGEAPDFMLAGAPDSPSGELPVAFDVPRTPPTPRPCRRWHRPTSPSLPTPSSAPSPWSRSTRPGSRGSRRSPSSTAARSRTPTAPWPRARCSPGSAFGIVTTRIDPADAPGRPGRRHRPRRPRRRAVAGLRHLVPCRIDPDPAAQGPARGRVWRGRPGGLLQGPRRSCGCRRRSRAPTRSTSTAITRAIRQPASRRPTT